jgi:regulator of protease activity HflC (stomatin/prohibitin superfamily)
MVDELKKVPDAARVVLQQQMNDSRAAQGKALQAAGKADAEGNQAEADQLRAEAKTAGERNTAVSALYRQVFPAVRRPIGDIQALYGVRVPMEEK